jgi:hypothetical protein
MHKCHALELNIAAKAMRFWTLVTLMLVACSPPTDTSRRANSTKTDSAQQVSTWQCPVFYEPARSIWKRMVKFEVMPNQTDKSDASFRLFIDGVAVHGFSLNADQISTHLDNEHIAIDLSQKTWRSDLRGLATGQGVCQPV